VGLLVIAFIRTLIHADEFIVGPGHYDTLQAAVYAAADFEVFQPHIQVFTGASIGIFGNDDIEIIAVRPQEYIPEIPQAEAPDTMSGGGYSVSGAFVSIGTPKLVGFCEFRLASSRASGGSELVISWPRTVRTVSVETTTALGAPGSWTTLAVQPVANGEIMSVTLPLTGQQQFFRLRY
jgi:hypothetical protein